RLGRRLLPNLDAGTRCRCRAARSRAAGDEGVPERLSRRDVGAELHPSLVLARTPSTRLLLSAFRLRLRFSALRCHRRGLRRTSLVTERMLLVGVELRGPRAVRHGRWKLGGELEEGDLA